MSGGTRRPCESPSRNNGLDPESGFDLGETRYLLYAPHVGQAPGRSRSTSTGWPTARPTSTLRSSSRELPGLRSLRGGVAGKVAGRVHFGRRSGTAVAAADPRAARRRCSASAACSRCSCRCRRRRTWRSSHPRRRRRAYPPDFEPVLAPGGRISIGELVDGGAAAEPADRAAARAAASACATACRRRRRAVAARRTSRLRSWRSC